jgi:hypothetical protein
LRLNPLARSQVQSVALRNGRQYDLSFHHGKVIPETQVRPSAFVAQELNILPEKRKGYLDLFIQSMSLMTPRTLMGSLEPREVRVQGPAVLPQSA